MNEAISEVSPGGGRDTAPDRSKDRRVTVIRAKSFPGSSYLSDLAKLASYRDLLYTLSVHRIKVRYKQSLLGVLWAILQPLSMMLIFTFVFSLIVRVPNEGLPYSVLAYTGLLAWTFFSTAVGTATNSMVSHAQLVTKVYFPREILPLTYVIAAMFDFLIASTLLFGLLAYHGVQISARALYAVPVVLVLACFATAMSLFFSALQVRFRDIGYAMPLLLQLWMFASPVIYPLSAVPERFRRLYMINPLAGLIENFRQVILMKATPDFSSLGQAAVISVLLLAASYAYFKHVEATLADVI